MCLLCALDLGVVRFVLEVVERTRDIFAAVEAVVCVVLKLLCPITSYRGTRPDWSNRDTADFVRASIARA